MGIDPLKNFGAVVDCDMAGQGVAPVELAIRQYGTLAAHPGNNYVRAELRCIFFQR